MHACMQGAIKVLTPNRTAGPARRPSSRKRRSVWHSWCGMPSPPSLAGESGARAGQPYLCCSCPGACVRTCCVGLTARGALCAAPMPAGEWLPRCRMALPCVGWYELRACTMDALDTQACVALKAKRPQGGPLSCFGCQGRGARAQGHMQERLSARPAAQARLRRQGHPVPHESSRGPRVGVCPVLAPCAAHRYAACLPSLLAFCAPKATPKPIAASPPLTQPCPAASPPCFPRLAAMRVSGRRSL